MPPHIHHNATITFTPHLESTQRAYTEHMLRHYTQVNISSGAKAAKRGGHLQPRLHYKMGAVPPV